MKPYYECSEGVLYHGDCLEIMPLLKNKVDLVLTDPPYGMNFVSNHRKEKHVKIENDDNMFWIDDYIEKLYPLAKENTAQYFFCSFHNVDVFKQAIQSKFKIKNLLVWEKNNTSMGDLENDFAPKHELIWFSQKGTRKIQQGRTPNIFKFNRTDNRYHPTQKPVDLLKHLIKKFSNQGEVVLDTFSGSGGVAIACIETNRKFIMIEKEKKYCDIAVQRIEKALHETSMLRLIQ